VVTSREKRNRDELERRRLAAAQLFSKEESDAEVARRVGVSRESVRRWRNQVKLFGSPNGLRKALRAGRKSKMDSDDLHRLEAILRRGPRRQGFPDDRWTLDRISRMILKEFKIFYCAGHIAWILHKRLKWFYQSGTWSHRASTATTSRKLGGTA
jgi:transposase